MPPSPSFRRSPTMEPRADGHKRGTSPQSRPFFKGKDDDLALFNEMQSREEDNFLLQPTDDFEDILSLNVKPFPEIRLGINIPSRGESNDLLNVDGGKNDYDWLLTPPETPLFSSLDDESTPANLVHNGRARSRPISISRTSTMEKRSSRGSPSPQRLSPSPQSGSSTFRGRPSSAPHTTATASLKASRRASPPPAKPLPRTSGSPPHITSGVRGTSPVRTNRGNSASPKIRAWQSNIPGFSLEAPPNLRTSLADRPATYVRGSSPASRASNSSSKFHRQSMSPTASRSIGSSHSQDRERQSSHSKGSVLSSGDDDADSLQSTSVSINERLMSRRGVIGFSNSKPLAFSKKHTKTFSPSSAPKRSYDYGIRQMDRKNPQNMFRPLLSSVPSSTIYTGKASATHRAMLSRNSSVTTCSNTSSDQATSGAHDTEGSDQYQDDMASESARAPLADVQDDVFAIDEMDVTSEDIGLKAHDTLSNAELNEPDKSCITSILCDSGIHFRPMLSVATSEAADMEDNYVEADNREKTLMCSICGCWYHADEVDENEHNNICPQCEQRGKLLTTQNSSIPLLRISEELNKPDPNLAIPGHFSEASLHERDTRDAQVHASPPLQSCSLVGGETIQLTEERTTVCNPSHASKGLIEMHKSVDKSDSNIEVTGGQGISVLLLKRSNSLKLPLIHGRTFSSSSISYDDLLNRRDLTSSMRISGSHGRISTSSSVDLASARHNDLAAQKQLSSMGTETNSQPQSSVSQGFGVSRHELPSNQALENGQMQNHIPSVSGTLVSVEASRENLPLMDNSMVNTEFDNSRASIGVNEGHEIGDDPEKKLGGAWNVEESVFLESYQAEKITMPDNRDNEIEVAGDPQCSIPTMSEIEIADSHPSSPRSHIDLEDLEDASATTHPDRDANGLSLEHVDDVIDESVEDEEQEGRKTRSLTMEEATDTILFCSSIVRDLAYKAASISIQKEKENLQPLHVSRPTTITIPEKHRRDPRARKKTRSTSAETEPKSSPLTKHDDKSNEPPMVQSVGLPNYVHNDTMKPPKLESKCNCTIM